MSDTRCSAKRITRLMTMIRPATAKEIAAPSVKTRRAVWTEAIVAIGRKLSEQYRRAAQRDSDCAGGSTGGWSYPCVSLRAASAILIYSGISQSLV